MISLVITDPCCSEYKAVAVPSDHSFQKGWMLESTLYKVPEAGRWAREF